MPAVVDDSIISAWKVDARELVAGLDQSTTKIREMERAGGTATTSVQALARSKDDLRKQLRPAGEQMEKVRSAMNLAGVAANQAAGATAAWVQVTTQVVAQGGAWAAAIAGVGIAIGKIVQHYREADEFARQKSASQLLLGVTEGQIDLTKRLVVDLADTAALKVAQTAQLFSLSQEDMTHAINAAKADAEAGLASFEAAFLRHARNIGSEQTPARRFTELGEQIHKAEDRVATLQDRLERLRELDRAGGGTVSGFRTEAQEIERQIAAANEQLDRLRGQLASVGGQLQKEGMAEFSRGQEQAAKESGRRLAEARQEGEREVADIGQGRSIEDEIWFQRIQAEIAAEEAAAERKREINRELAQQEAALEAQKLAAKRAAKAQEVADAKAAKDARIAFESELAMASIGAAREAAALFGVGQQQVTKEHAQAKAEQALIEAAFATATGFALLAVGNAPGATSAFVAAGKFAAVAGIAAAVASSAPSAPAQQAPPAFDPGGFGRSADSFGGRSSIGGAAPAAGQHVTIIINGPAFATRAEIGKEIDRALKEHNRLRGI